MNNRLLLNEEPLIIMPQLAVKIGLNESIVLQQIHYWTKINEKADKNFKGGYYWTFNSYEDWKEQFPFWSISTIKRTISSLEHKKLIISGNYNRLKIDRTKWYRIDYLELESIDTSPLCQNEPMDSTKMNRPLPETIKENSKSKYHRKKKDGSLTEYQAKAVIEAANIERHLNQKRCEYEL